MEGICRLCKNYRELQLSHIIPNFVFKWLRKSSISYIRKSNEPDRRVQDGEKRYLLCKECEERLSAWETIFANKIFSKLHSDQDRKMFYQYGDWCLKFAVSVSWRVLECSSDMGLEHFSEQQNMLVAQALETWRQYLLGQTSTIGQFEQHALPLDMIKTHTFNNLSPFINRYFTRSIDVDIPCSSSAAFIYSKMGRFLLVGIIQEPNHNDWQGTKIHAKKGIIGSRKFRLPKRMGAYINSRAEKAATALASMSDIQAQKVSETIRSNVDAFLSSDVFSALLQDKKLFGDDALEVTENIDDQ